MKKRAKIASTLTVRLTQEEAQIIKRLSVYTGEVTSSKSMIAACMQYHAVMQDKQRQEEKNGLLESKIGKLSEELEKYRRFSASLKEILE